MKKNIYYITHWESWHWFLKYVIIAPAWIWNCIRSGSIWFFTTANPTITFGGFAGETKREVYDQLPEGTWPKSIFISASTPLREIALLINDKKLIFPIIAKPDSGLMGFMFRKIDSMHELRQYHAAMTVDYILQEYIDYPLEVSVFYYRYPDQDKGTITGFVKKEFLEVIGDGKSTLLELILQHPRAQFRIAEFKGKHASHLKEILSPGQRYCLSYALNLSRGSRLISLEREKDERLLKIFDDLSHYTRFYYGRYDIRCQSIEDLKDCKNFSILEFNGCGAEPHHVYGNGNSFIKACLILIKHWNIMYHISKQNHQVGAPYWSHKVARTFYKDVKDHLKTLKALDQEFEFTSLTHKYNKNATNEQIIEKLYAHLSDQLFPCLAAKAALTHNHIRIFIAEDMNSENSDKEILSFLYQFIDEYRTVKDDFYSAAVIFKTPEIPDEEMFETLFWKKLQSLAYLDAQHYRYDKRVTSDTDSPFFSFSLKEEAFYLIGLHPCNSRPARQFPYASIVFNAHAQFEKLREDNHFTKMQEVVRMRDMVYSGSLNPMLSDFGDASEAIQYTGKQYDKTWKCPLHIPHDRKSNHSAP